MSNDTRFIDDTIQLRPIQLGYPSNIWGSNKVRVEQKCGVQPSDWLASRAKHPPDVSCSCDPGLPGMLEQEQSLGRDDGREYRIRNSFMEFTEKRNSAPRDSLQSVHGNRGRGLSRYTQHMDDIHDLPTPRLSLLLVTCSFPSSSLSLPPPFISFPSSSNFHQ